MPEEVIALKQCTSYAAGHTVHWIQALHVANKDQARAASRPGLVVAVVGDRITVPLDDGKAVELLTHDTPRVLALSPALPFDGEVERAVRLAVARALRPCLLRPASGTWAFRALCGRGGRP